jgi:hypothetical protein
MTNSLQDKYIQGSLFEEDFLIRTLGPLVNSPEIALTELVANAWDAGAKHVNIKIPDDYEKKLIVEDDGIGLTQKEFHYRWMRLGYNRLKHQGKVVEFPPGINNKRIAYGRNGIGRHGLLCFNNEYSVITNKAGGKSIFTITTLSEEQPFVIKEESFQKSINHGTRLEVKVIKNLPNSNYILNIISAKFLHDPNFIVSINGKTVPLEEHKGLINSKKLQIGDVTLHAHFIDSQKAGKSTQYQGIAFWQGGRLIGEPSWILGNEMVIDGRTTFAKRYTVVIKTEDLSEHIKEDWTGFIKSEFMNNIYKEVNNYVSEIFSKIARESIDETKRQIKSDFSTEYRTLTPLGKFEVNEAIESIALTNPTAKPEAISLAVGAIINLEKTRSGRELLVRLSKLNEDDINGLNDLLENWSIRDALSVLDEIDNRLSVIEAIRKLSNDKSVDELNTLHPLVTSARWLFGPEFESNEYSSNRQLQTATETIFKKKIKKNVFNNHKKRPDIVILNDSTMSITGTDSIDLESNLSTVNKVLIIELKKGDFKLTKTERNQATDYVEEFMNCGILIGNPYIEAYVVGKSYSEKIQPISSVSNKNNVEMGKVRISTFSQLVDTAEKRLFGLRDKLNERYEDIPGMKLYTQHINQMGLEFQKKNTA